MISVNASLREDFSRDGVKPLQTQNRPESDGAQKTAQTTPVKSVQEPTDAQKVAVSS
jgi:hypothetical protein